MSSHEGDNINLCSYPKGKKNHPYNNFSVNKLYGKGLYTIVFLPNMVKMTWLSIYYDFCVFSFMYSKTINTVGF